MVSANLCMMGTASSQQNGRRYTDLGYDGPSSNSPTTGDFGYEEFDGKDGKTCPTCRGTGRISRGQEEELVALIPYHDKRLAPRRTTLYVGLAIGVCLIICGLVLFFILPRSVEIYEGKITNYTVKINTTTSSTEITLNNQFNITNTNFFHIKVTTINVEAFFDHIQVGVGKLTKSSVSVAPRTKNFPVSIKIKMFFNPLNQLDYVSEICTSPKRRVHDVVIKLQATLTSTYLQHSEQNSLTSYRYIDCSPNRHS